MSNPTELLPGTSIAATSFVTGSQVHLRVYTQDIEGGIREARFDGHWSGGTMKDVITKAKPHSPLAAFNYNNGASIRVYYLTPENMIQEMCQDNGGQWFAGALDKAKLKASPVSRLTVIGQTWGNNHISLYYQRPDEAIGEIMQDDQGWVQGNPVGDKPLLGTGLAAVKFATKKESGIRLYYQVPDGTLAEAGIDKGSQWFKHGGLPKIKNAAPATNLAAFAYGTDNPLLKMLFVGKQNMPNEMDFDGKWQEKKFFGHTLVSPGSGMAIVPAQNADSLRLYLQDETNRIQEYIFEKDQSDWKKGSLIPVGNLQQ
jgi:hypothetical protein